MFFLRLFFIWASLIEMQWCFSFVLTAGFINIFDHPRLYWLSQRVFVNLLFFYSEFDNYYFEHFSDFNLLNRGLVIYL